MIGDPSVEIRRRVDALSTKQRRALADALARDGRAHAPERLVAFIVPSDDVPSDAELRAFVEARVPEYMVPSRFVSLERLPRTAAGKLDRRALANERMVEVESRTANPPRGPRNDIESKLVAIWKAVLKVDDVGVDDDFFELGGDSLLSIRVIGRAGREGIRIAPEKFFERPTIAHLAASIASAGAATAVRIAQDDAVGEAPLTPIQHWFLDAIPHHRDWWNQSYLLDVDHTLAEAQLREIVDRLVRHHDALRLRLVSRDGQWRQEVLPESADVPFRIVRLGDVPAEFSARVVVEGEQEQSSLRLEEGRLFRCVYFESTTGWRRVLFVAHHVVVDGVSWSVLLDDFATLVAQTVARQPLRLPDKTTSARRWATALAANSPQSYAQSLQTPNINADASTVTLTLGSTETARITHDAARGLGVSTHAILLTALGAALHDLTGEVLLRMDVEGHGRDAVSGYDVSRTVGWFTTVSTVTLTTAGADDPAIDQTARAVHATFEATSPNAPAQPRPRVLFNYLGVHDLTLPDASGLHIVNEPHGPTRDPATPRAYEIEVNSHIEHGELVVAIEHSTRLHSRARIERLVDSFRRALDAIVNAASMPTPSYDRVDAASLATIADLLAEIDDA